MDIANAKLSIKNLLFTKAIPNHVIPASIIPEKVYTCTDCGDKFLFRSSYEDHVNRKTMLITYKCRHCNATKVFYNRCNLLLHIRSHSFKTATINVQDLKVETLPISMYKYAKQINTDNNNAQADKIEAFSAIHCYECAQLLSGVGPAHASRANHFKQNTGDTYSCPVCLFMLPSACALRTHLRFHFKFAPYFCPECGNHVTNKNAHMCDGFKLIKATTRLKCPMPQCHLFHPNDFRDHLKNKHIKKVFKCPMCVVACFNEATMQKHLRNHPSIPAITTLNALIFYQCELCPGRLVLQNHIETHLGTHMNLNVYPCWSCGDIFNQVLELLEHHVRKHGCNSKPLLEMMAIAQEAEDRSTKSKRVYRVVKQCDQCKRNFTYKCKYNEISVLPSECPYKCSSSKLKDIHDVEKLITCGMCKTQMSSNWKEVQKHFAEAHKDQRCVNPKLVVKREDVKKYLLASKRKAARRLRAKRRQPVSKTNVDESLKTAANVLASSETGHGCVICNEACQTKPLLEEHMKTHRDPCMAYQCMECGQSFVVKPSFSKHLLLKHGITDAEEYINSKQCFNVDALEKQINQDMPTEPLKENQCNICRDQFNNAEDLEKHYRVHGMAFLLKNSSSKSP